MLLTDSADKAFLVARVVLSSTSVLYTMSKGNTKAYDTPGVCRTPVIQIPPASLKFWLARVFAELTVRCCNH